jgi:hypothetical protein
MIFSALVAAAAAASDGHGPVAGVCDIFASGGTRHGRGTVIQAPHLAWYKNAVRKITIEIH